MNIDIRNETASDYRAVEELTREAFWNLYVPGCDEHYLTHLLREHPDFIAQLDFVALFNEKIIGNILYTTSRVSDANDPQHTRETITFGPVCVLPDFQKRGVGSQLIQHSLGKAKAIGYKGVILQGHPHNYCKHGFKSAKDFRIYDSDGRSPYSLLARELDEGYFSNHKWRYVPSSGYTFDMQAALEYDTHFEPKDKAYRYTQEEFSIASRAYLV